MGVGCLREGRLANPQTVSADGKWWWDGSRWQPAVSADGRWRWEGARWVPARHSSPGTWVRRIASLVVGIPVVVASGSFGLGAAIARPIDPVGVNGNLTRVVIDCPSRATWAITVHSPTQTASATAFIRTISNAETLPKPVGLPTLS